MDWKVIVTLAVVLVVIFFFVGSSPGVSGMLTGIGDRLGSLASRLGIVWDETGDHEITLVLRNPGALSAELRNATVRINGTGEAAFDNGDITFSHATLFGFNGKGTISTLWRLDGTASTLFFDASRLGELRLAVSSYPQAGSISAATIAEIRSESAQGQLILNESITNFVGPLALSSFKGRIIFASGQLELHGTVDSLSLPTAGIKLE